MGKAAAKQQGGMQVAFAPSDTLLKAFVGLVVACSLEDLLVGLCVDDVAKFGQEDIFGHILRDQ